MTIPTLKASTNLFAEQSTHRPESKGKFTETRSRRWYNTLIITAITALFMAPLGAATPANAQGLGSYIVIADSGSGQIFMVAPDGTQTTPVTGISSPNDGVAVDKFGNFYVSSIGTVQVIKVAPDGTQTVLPFNGLSETPIEVLVDDAGNVYVADAQKDRVLKLTPEGVQTTVVDVSPFSITPGIALDSSGNLYVTLQTSNDVLKVAPDGTQTVLPFSGLNSPTDIDVDVAGNVYVASLLGNTVTKLTPSGTQSILPFSGLVGPTGVIVDDDGNVYVASVLTNEVFKLTPDGTQTTIGTGLSSPWQLQSLDPVTIAGTPTDGTVGDPYSGFSFTVGGFASSTVSVTEGSLPPGLSLSPDGIITGTPSVAGVFTFQVTATGFTNSASLFVTITINPKLAPIVPPTPVHPAELAKTGFDTTMVGLAGLYGGLLLFVGGAICIRRITRRHG